MLHEDVLNFMLANTCHHDDGEYTFDLHCMEVKVKAELLTVEPSFKYKILSISYKEI